MEPTPTLRIVRGTPDPAELAALTVVLAALGTPVPAREAGSAWADHASRLRTPPRPGPDAWRRSALPR